MYDEASDMFMTIKVGVKVAPLEKRTDNFKVKVSFRFTVYV